MKKPVDYKLFFTVLVLVIFWMIMISSVSVYSSFRVTSSMVANWYIQEAYNHFYVLRNIAHVVVWMLTLLVVVKVHYSFIEKYAKQIFWTALFLLVVVLVMWMSLWWAKWWISIPWVPFTIQPTEFLKISIIVFLAAFFKKYKWYLQSFQNWFIPFIWIIWIIVLLVWLQPDFWTILVIVPVAVIMFFYAWANIKHLFITTFLWIFLATTIYAIWDYDKETWIPTNKLWYITQRIDTFVWDNKNLYTKVALKDSRKDQIRNSLITIWSWGFDWLGFWKSIQKYWYLPEVQWDFIFSVIVEELWFMWGLLLLIFYLHIWYRGFYIASRVTDLFAKYAAVWISTRIMLQAFINIWVNLNVMPLTGITLPFISYGWSSLLSLMIALGLLLNISRYMEEKSKYSRKTRKKYMF
jgi:cell division protein FtsW